jgi:hypothetical protein
MHASGRHPNHTTISLVKHRHCSIVIINELILSTRSEIRLNRVSSSRDQAHSMSDDDNK